MNQIRSAINGRSHAQTNQSGYNEESITDLFRKYEEIGFIYPAKREVLAPYMSTITRNWEALRESEDDLLWIFTNQSEDQSEFASVCAWRQSNQGVMAQHLVSNGNPFLSLKLMLAAQLKASADPSITSSQNWFRPNNRYAYRVFASMYEKLGKDRASVLAFHYLHMPILEMPHVGTMELECEEVQGYDPAFADFVAAQYGEVFVQGEELCSEDLGFRQLNGQFQKCGLERSRTAIKVTDEDGKILGALIANQAPLGLNFSFLENRCYFILDKSLGMDERKEVLLTMNQLAETLYEDFDLQFLPIVTDEESSAALQPLGASFIREYMQSIWLRSGFDLWFDHIDSFLSRIERRAKA